METENNTNTTFSGETQGRIVDVDFGNSNRVLSGIFKWMAWGLFISAVASIVAAMSPVLINFILQSQLGFFALIIIELGTVWYLSARISKMSVSTARTCFIAYAIISGLTLSIIFFAYELTSIISIFFGTAAMFAVLALYGARTSYDLTKVGRIAYFGLIGLIIASLINIFIGGTMVDLILAWLGVAIFTGLTMYDVQKLKRLGQKHMSDEDIKRVQVLGALTLYLDFINLFLDLLRIFGRRK